MKIGWTPKPIRTFKKLVCKNPQLRLLIEATLELLSEDCFNPSLRTQKLTGDLSGIWSCSIDYDHRILFEFVTDPEDEEEAILLLKMGSHDEVY
ncbi:addiction module toxin, RelE/StbE family [Oscillatoria nigro-viridis PCC 7112]|uniref:Addiction module toxin, RelE/StbE family n=1 Tax=Phormidium nigroviride PCC 7112 TaxID=179408 RepID=K9VCY9_9CYAN|nr:addiction module toxin, RelE/StbE family [Oscillatoria nigro-viridis]AFZ05337.1 addiction module toxin, RelE/StbE family [Oscillatoria nigro-viridis PCC 7112]